MQRAPRGAVKSAALLRFVPRGGAGGVQHQPGRGGEGKAHCTRVLALLLPPGPTPLLDVCQLVELALHAALAALTLHRNVARPHPPAHLQALLPLAPVVRAVHESQQHEAAVLGAQIPRQRRVERTTSRHPAHGRARGAAFLAKELRQLRGVLRGRLALAHALLARREAHQHLARRRVDSNRPPHRLVRGAMRVSNGGRLSNVQVLQSQCRCVLCHRCCGAVCLCLSIPCAQGHGALSPRRCRYPAARFCHCVAWARLDVEA